MTKTMALAVAVVAAARAKADIPRLDSSQFDYKYDMIVLPSAQNLDNDGAVDFTLSDSSKFSLGTGVNYGSLVIDTTAGGKFLMSGADAGTAGGVWRNSGISAATGYTVEARLKITDTTGAQAGIIVLNASVDDTVNAWLKFWAGSIWWGETQIHNVDATAYHTYRIVREAGSSVHSVYVDGELVASDLGSGFTYSTPLKRLLVGSPGGTYKGKAQVAFIRFHKGGYAPPVPNDKKNRRWSGHFPSRYEMDAADTRFVGTGTGTDWTATVASGANITQHRVLSATLPEGTTAWWRANDSVWKPKIGADTTYTVEFKIQIKSKWNLSTVGDRVVQFWCGNPRAAAIFYIGTNSVTWEPNGVATYTTITTGDNTDAMHTFRVTYDGATRHGYTLWRDGEVIGTYLVDSTVYNSALGNNVNFLRFGVVSSTTVGGSFDMDYIRWTTDGEWDYRDAPGAFFMVVR
jgi:hypothetical protein